MIALINFFLVLVFEMLLWWSLPIPRFAPSDWSSPFPIHQRPDIAIQWVGVWVCGGDVHVIFRTHRTCKCLRVWAPCFFHSLATIVNYLYYTCKTSQSSCMHAGIDLLSSNYCNYNSTNHLHEGIKYRDMYFSYAWSPDSGVARLQGSSMHDFI